LTMCVLFLVGELFAVIPSRVYPAHESLLLQRE
jgi:hypothetical protein